MSMIEQVILAEKYRPKTVGECILPDHAKKYFDGIAKTGKIPHLFLSGPPGIGKTTVAFALANELEMDVRYVNGSNEGRSIDVLRNDIVAFCTSRSLNGRKKMVIFDEADYSNAESVQPALRSMMDDFSKNTVFVFTCNYPNRVISPLQSRCTAVDFGFTAKEKPKMMARMMMRIVEILDKEGVTYKKNTIAEIVKAAFPDLRRTLNEIQGHISEDNVLEQGVIAGVVLDGEFETLIKILADKDFNQMRKWVATHHTLDIANITRILYDKAHNHVPDPSVMAELTMILAEYSYRNAFCADKEINIAAMLATIMRDCDLSV